MGGVSYYILLHRIKQSDWFVAMQYSTPTHVIMFCLEKFSCFLWVGNQGNFIKVGFMIGTFLENDHEIYAVVCCLCCCTSCTVLDSCCIVVCVISLSVACCIDAVHVAVLPSPQAVVVAWVQTLQLGWYPESGFAYCST